jgi:hypothetical protein
MSISRRDELKVNDAAQITISKIQVKAQAGVFHVERMARRISLIHPSK